MSKKTVRVVLDATLTLMIVFEMFIQYTGSFLHEVVGFAFFATVVAHLALSAKWMRSTARATKAGRVSGRNAALAIMGCLLAVDMVILGASSVAISEIIASTGFVWTLGTYATWATVHAVSSYALCALVVVHLAMHWVFLANALRVPYNPERRRAIGAGVHAAAAVGAVALGVMAAREALPQAVAQAAGTDSENTGRDNPGPFDNPSDIRYEQPSAQSGDSSASSSSASATAQSKGKSRKSKKGSATDSKQGVSSSSSSSDSNATASGTDSSSGGREDASSAFDAGTVEGGDSGSGSTDLYGESSSVSGICTLCRKQCPLSAPRCDRPYEEGLI